MNLKGKHIVLGISAGIAAYKSAVLVRALIKKGAEVQVVMTPNAKQMITPATLAALSSHPVVSEFFAANTGEWHSHVDLGLWADLMLIAPATACTLGKMANGIADNMLVTTYLSAKEKVMIAPAMDLDMWAHPSTQRNIETLKRDGVIVIEPGSGFLASGLSGKGRMAEPEVIADIAEKYLIGSEYKPLQGKKIVITAGPTYEAIDPVRFIGNYSSGKMGFALAKVCAELGAEVSLITGPVSLSTPENPLISRYDVSSAKEMLEVALQQWEDADAAILAAAVADYTPVECHDKKIKREKCDEMTLRLVKNPDIARTLGQNKGNKVIIGFALETDNELENATGKMKSKNLDYIVLNSLRDPEAGFMKDTNKISILSADGDVTDFGAKLKIDVARDIVTSTLLKNLNNGIEGK